MHTINDCPRCQKDFMYHSMDVPALSRVVAWDADTKEPCRWEVICQECDEKERAQATDVNVGNSVLCAAKGCSNDANEFSKYCNCCYDEKFQFN